MPIGRIAARSSLLVCLVLTTAPAQPASPSARPSTPSPEAKTPLHQAPFAEVIDRYAFIGDFSQKPAERPISSELFWRYPFTLPRLNFPIDYQLGDGPGQLPATEGDDRPTQHLNRGRRLYLEGKFEEARQVWLSARARHGKNFPYHRRNDYLIALAFLKLSQQLATSAQGNYQRSDVKVSHSNTATFLSWAFIKKQDLPDSVLSDVTPAALYDLAAIYFLYERYQAAHATAELGLNFLRAKGRQEHRGDFRRLLAESWIRDHNYLRAVQELDTMIRQEMEPKGAARAFARVGDIYFDLNNYELAEDAYAISQNLDAQINQVVPLSAMLRGEALFWLGQYSQAQTMLQYGLESSSYKNAAVGLPESYRAWASLRIADAYLARYRQAVVAKAPDAQRLHLLEKSRLAYFQVGHAFPRSEPARIAAVRRSCLELPTYEGKNVGHARRDLKAARDTDLPLQAIELAWSCELLSYAQREKDLAFIENLKTFYAKFPASRFLDQYVPYVHEIRAGHLDEYFAANDLYRATAYYENYRELLFRQPTPTQQARLFAAYVDTFTSPKARPFLDAYKPKATDDAMAALRLAVFYSELDPKEQAGAWPKANAALARQLTQQPPALAATAEDELRPYWQRLLASPAAPLHRAWMTKLALGWGRNDSRYVCELAVPLISQRLDSAKGLADYRELWQEVAPLSSSLLPGLFDKNLACSESLLKLEARLSHLLPLTPDFAARWNERCAWPQKALMIPLIWDAAERLAAGGDKENAEKLWQFLSSQDSKKFPEATFARARLDKTQTELEQLWQ